MVVWKFSPIEPTWEELKASIIDTSHEKVRVCTFQLPKNINNKTFAVSEVGVPLILSPLIEEGRYEEAAEAARVNSILQSVVSKTIFYFFFLRPISKSFFRLYFQTSFSGYLTVNETHKNNLFFWFFPAESLASQAPLVVWLQGGPGWPSLFGLFKENGPFLMGWDPDNAKPKLLNNLYKWTKNHNMLYIDNPVGAGFSFTESEDGNPETDQQVAKELLEGLVQFMKIYPAMVSGAEPSKTPVYAFGESYGGSYVISLAKTYLEYRENDGSYISELWLKGIGIGNGGISAQDQYAYADFFNSLAFITKAEYDKLKSFENTFFEALEKKNYSRASDSLQKTLGYFVKDLMPYTNIYDFTFNGNYLTNNEYVCYLQQPQVRKAIHVGNATFHSDNVAYVHLRNQMMISKNEWLSETLGNLLFWVFCDVMTVSQQYFRRRTAFLKKVE